MTNLYWTQTERPDDLAVPDAVVDILFELDCRRLPVDHAFALSAALLEVCPWMAETPGFAIHTVHVAGSQNGWERPAHGTDHHLHLSRRTRLTLRAPQAGVERVLKALPGARLTIEGCPLAIGAGKVRPLSRETTLFARHLAAPEIAAADTDEGAFLEAAVADLADLGIRVRKALCGKTLALATPRGPLPTRSLLLADLRPSEALRLQEVGLGPHRLMGCGIFIPHKGIDALGETARAA